MSADVVPMRNHVCAHRYATIGSLTGKWLAVDGYIARPFTHRELEVAINGVMNGSPVFNSMKDRF